MTRLKLLRLKRGLTQREMSQLLGLHATQLSRLEKGWFKRCPNPKGLEPKLKSFFGVEESFESLMETASADTAPVGPAADAQKRL